MPGTCVNLPHLPGNTGQRRASPFSLMEEKRDADGHTRTRPEDDREVTGAKIGERSQELRDHPERPSAGCAGRMADGGSTNSRTRAPDRLHPMLLRAGETADHEWVYPPLPPRTLGRSYLAAKAGHSYAMVREIVGEKPDLTDQEVAWEFHRRTGRGQPILDESCLAEARSQRDRREPEGHGTGRAAGPGTAAQPPATSSSSKTSAPRRRRTSATLSQQPASRDYRYTRGGGRDEAMDHLCESRKHRGIAGGLGLHCASKRWSGVHRKRLIGVVPRARPWPRATEARAERAVATPYRPRPGWTCRHAGRESGPG